MWLVVFECLGKTSPDDGRVTLREERRGMDGYMLIIIPKRSVVQKSSAP